MSNRLLPSRVLCPCCGWRGHEFYDYIEVGYSVRGAACPVCDSHSRHRTFFLWLSHDYPLKTRSGNAIVFAPEKSLAKIWDQAEALNVFRVDIAPARNVDALVDLQRLPFASDTIDLLWCHHVLEHVEDDRKGIEELYRVLRPRSGELIVSVPMHDEEKTLEYGSPRKEESGHWRMYGSDFVELLAEVGFSTEPVDFDLGVDIQQRYGATVEKVFVCRKS